MTDSIFHLDKNGDLVEMREEPYESEDLLQGLLEDHPALLAGAQMTPDEPRRWLFVKREVGVPDGEDASNRWAVDHLFVDQDGVPTLVEVKRSSDSRIRREVVGQMLDYAANAVAYWPAERIRSEFEAGCQMRGIDPSEVITESLGDIDEEVFWASVKTNLQAGRLRLLFVADSLPPELRRIIEFLNEQSDPMEVLGVEVRHYVGDHRRTIVPRVVGQTAGAQQRKGTRSPKTKWTAERFFAEVTENHGAAVSERYRMLLEWAQDRGLRIWWGEGKFQGSFIPIHDADDGKHYLFSAWTNGRVATEFIYIARATPYGPVEKRRGLLKRLNQIDGIDIPDDAIDREPSFTLADLPDDAAVRDFLSIWDDYLDTVRGTHSQSTTPNESRG